MEMNDEIAATILPDALAIEPLTALRARSSCPRRTRREGIMFKRGCPCELVDHAVSGGVTQGS